jgi:hypothetical protein
MSDLSLLEARESVDRAKTHLEAAAEEIVRQIGGRAWVALGYESWDEMREVEYRGAAVIVPREDRPELVARLRAEGLSQKQIGDTIGVSQGQVSDDLRNISSDNTEQPATRPDSLGRERPTSYRPRPTEPSFQPPRASAPDPQQQQREEEEQAHRDRFTSICQHVYLLAPYGGYPNLDAVMAGYDPQRYVDPPDIALNEDRLLAVRRFCDMALEWLKENQQ